MLKTVILVNKVIISYDYDILFEIDRATPYLLSSYIGYLGAIILHLKSPEGGLLLNQIQRPSKST